jgi:plastocyanin
MRRSAIIAVALAVPFALAACKGGEKKKVAAASEAGGSTSEPAAPSGPPPGPKGTIRGHVALEGEAPEMPVLPRGTDPVCAKDEMRAETITTSDDGDLANVVVRVAPGTVKGWAPSEPVLVDQTKCMYRPRVQGAVAGQKLLVSNADATAHNVHLRDVELGKRQGKATLWNRQQPVGMKPIEGTVEDVDVIRLKCDQHGWMSGYIVVSDNGYHQVTGAEGRFELEVPAGEITLQAWHEFYGIKEQKVTVPEGGAVDVDFTFDHAADNPTASANRSP